MEPESPHDDQAAEICAHCGNDGGDYTETDAQLLYTACGHALYVAWQLSASNSPPSHEASYRCIKCTNRLFRNKRSILCPKCSTPFAQSTLSRKSLEQQQFEAELKVRKELSQMYVEALRTWQPSKSVAVSFERDPSALYSFTRTRESFDSEIEYNAYLEMVETYSECYSVLLPSAKARAAQPHGSCAVATLASTSEDKEATRAAIAAYQSSHAQDITLAAQAAAVAAAKWQAQQSTETAARMARAAAAAAADEADRAAAEEAAADLMDSMLSEGGAVSAAGGPSHPTPQGKPLLPHVPLGNIPEPQLIAPATSRTVAALAYWKRVKRAPPPAALARDREQLLRTVNAPRQAAAGFSLARSTEQLRRQALAGL